MDRPVPSIRSTKLCAALLALIVCQPGRAHASADASPPFRVSLLGGYGFDFQGDLLWKFGVGASVGYTFSLPIYVGLTSTYHFGTSANEAGVPRHHLHYHTASVGYAFALDHATITPQVLVGAAVVRTVGEVDGGYVSSCAGPAIDLDIAVSKQLFIATSVRYVYVTRAVGSGDSSGLTAGLGLHVGAGLRF